MAPEPIGSGFSFALRTGTERRCPHATRQVRFHRLQETKAGRSRIAASPDHYVNAEPNSAGPIAVAVVAVDDSTAPYPGSWHVTAVVHGGADFCSGSARNRP